MPILYLINAEQFFMAPCVPPDEGMLVRYGQPLTDEQRQLLETTRKDDPALRARSRAHGLLLSAHGPTIQDSAKTSQVHRVTVSAWIKNWEPPGAQRLPDQPRRGRPSPRRPEERDLARQ
jgi:transposase